MRGSIKLLAVGVTAGALTVIGCAGDAESARTVESSRPRSLLELERQKAESPLRSDKPHHDFGEIPITGGDVETVFQVSNEAVDEVELAAVYTSCGCTTAMLEFAEGSTAGPFGMPGHGYPSEIERTVAPGEGFKIRVTFDPAAHGPQGLGNIMRAVTLHTRDGGTTEFTIRAQVVES